MKHLKFILFLLICVAQLTVNSQSLANLVISSTPKFTLHKENGKHWIRVEFEIKNISTSYAKFLSHGINVFYSFSKDSILNNDTVTLKVFPSEISKNYNAYGVAEEAPFFILPYQKRKITSPKIYLPDVDILNGHKYFIIHINPEIAEFPFFNPLCHVEEDYSDNIKIFLHSLKPAQEYAIEQPSNIDVHPPGLYPDLKLAVSKISSSIQTNSQTGVKFKEYKFTCSITNTSNVTAVIDSVHSLTIQSWQAATCKSAKLAGAGGRKVVTGITKIKPGETIVVENQTATQPINATTKIHVELIYKAKEKDLMNNKVCITQ